VPLANIAVVVGALGFKPFPYGARNLKGSAGSNFEETSPPRTPGTPTLRVIGFAPGLKSTLSRSTQITDGLITESK
jgi:hypothetical protein